MEVLHVLFLVAGLVANAALTFFGVTAWFRLREVNKKADAMLRGVGLVTTIMMGQHVKENFEEVNRMKRTFDRLVENEQYEDAERMKAVIDKAERDALRSLEKFKETCGDAVNVIVTKVNGDRTTD